MDTSKSLLRLKILGTRGSITVSGRDHLQFGGNTSCYMIQAGEETIILDAGSGLINAPVEFPRPPHILLSHLHLDHLIGLGMYPRLSLTGRETFIHVPTAPGDDPTRLLDGMFSPPYWPLSLRDYRGDNRILPLTLPLKIGDFLIDGIPGSHPGGNLIFCLSWRGKRIIYASDYEYEDQSFQRLLKMADKADLVLFDGQYSQEEMESRIGFGHSTPRHGLMLLEQCKIGHLWLIHHDPHRSDKQLLEAENEIGLEKVHFAREGEEILI